MLDEGIEILREFEIFKKGNPNGGKEDFAQYLLATENEAEPSLTEGLPFDFPVKSIDEYLGWILGRLIHFASIWEKKAFEEIQLYSNKESGVLLYIMSHPGCTKSDVAKHSLVEKTTIFEIIKKLVRNGLLQETLSKDDRRKRELHLTKKGEIITFSALEKMKDLSSLLMGNLSKAEKIEFYKILKRLDSFHDRCYQSHKSSRWDDIKKDKITR